MSFPFKAVMAGEKEVIGSPRWSEPEGADARQRLIAPLRFDGRILQGLELVGRAHANLRNRDVSFRIIYIPADNRRDAIQMAGIDWRPKTPHGNEHPNSPADLLGVVMDGDHHHSFDLNWLPKSGRPLKSLPIAEPINPEFQSFTELIDGVGRLFRISNAGSAITSPWPQDLFDV
ncbi:hypothetical protein [Erythrobacter westpacificensis]|uniref:hypothetical protein n=1 Tax=Erythrobacter westpacificensis TaxID=1055231 RepID=UPI0031F77C24